MILLAVVFGAMAIFAGQKYLERQASRMQPIQVVAQQPEAPAQTIVVAAMPLKFGVEVSRQQLREIAWPAGKLPKGAFAKIDEVVDGKTRRVALAAFEENEPLLKAKVTGPGQRGSLAAVIQQGMKAVTVRVNDINGVAGFVLPGERVDVLLVRNLGTEAWSDVLLQNVKVLAVDQLADESSDKPALVKAVTVEVATADAQKLALAGAVGTLALALRSAGVAEREDARRIAVEDLSRPAETPPLPVAAYASAPAEEAPRAAVVGVSRGMKRQEYSVPVHGAPRRVETHTASAARPKT
jgi:pilus assembly protein CpaB